VFQLSFLNAGLLFFAAATVLPLLIWLLAKKKPPQLLFPSLRFIKLSQEQEKNKTKITNIILLIIRMLIILLTALAVARPMLASKALGSSSKHPPTALAIIVDTSYSMDHMDEGKSLLQKAMDAIGVINAQASEADRLILISRDGKWNGIHTQIYAGSIPDDALKTLAISWNPLPWDEVLSLADSKLSEAQMPNSEIYLLSDFVNESFEIHTEHPVAAIPLSDARERKNISVSEARVLPQIVGRAKQQTLEFRVSNHGSEAVSEVLIQAVVGDIKVAEKFIALPPRQSKLETITFELRDEGWISGYIEVLDEALMADNKAYFAFEYFQYPKVGVVSTSALPQTLNSILSVYGGGKKPDLIDPSALNLQRVQDYKLLVFYEFGSMTPRLREVLNQVDQREIGSLFCLSKTLSPDSKAFLEQRFGANIKGYSSEKRSIDFISPHHPVTSLIADKQRKYSDINGFWDAGGGTAIIASGKQPLALSTANSALWLWDIAQNSSFFIDPAFAVFAYRQAGALQNVGALSNEQLVGDNIRASELTLPSGETINLAGGQYLAAEPGLYALNPDAPNARKLAVNHDYQDSEPTKGEVKGKLRQFSANFRGEIFMSRLGRDLWKWLLSLALILVLTEIVIVRLQESKARDKE